MNCIYTVYNIKLHIYSVKILNYVNAVYKIERIKNMYVIVGLGNPGSKYENTRHNIGFIAIDAVSTAYNIPLDFVKHNAICGKGIISGEKVLLVKPQTFMNNSGQSVGEIIRYYKADPEEDLLVLYDDINLDVGRLRVRAKGSAGGHNGIKSIISHVGTEKFQRIRIGVGEKPKGWDLADYVLGRFPKNEEQTVENGIMDSVNAVKTVVEEGIDSAMNKFNGK